MHSFLHLTVLAVFLAIIISVIGGESNEEKKKPLVKLIGLVKRNPSLTPAQFHYYLRYVHSEKVKSNPATKKYIRGYVQSHTLMSAYANGEPPYDAEIALYFNSVADQVKFYSDPDYLRLVHPDEFVFADLNTTIFFDTEEAVIIKPVGSAAY